MAVNKKSFAYKITWLRSTKAVERRRDIRNLLAVLSMVASVTILLYVTKMTFFTSGPHYLLRNKPFNELTKAAIDIRLDQTRVMYQIGAAFIGLLWSLLIARKEEAVLVLKDTPEKIMIFLATLLLGFSFACHLFYVNKITDIYIIAGMIAGKKSVDKSMVEKSWVMKGNIFTEAGQRIDEIVNIPDIFEPGVNYLFVAQSFFLLVGIFSAILTFFSAHKLK